MWSESRGETGRERYQAVSCSKGNTTLTESEKSREAGRDNYLHTNIKSARREPGRRKKGNSEDREGEVLAKEG